MRVSIVSLSVVLLTSSACSKSEPAPAPLPPLLGILELPIALRGADAPEAGTRIEAAPGELRAGGAVVATLERGKFRAADIAGEVIPKLAEAVPANAAVTLALHAAIPFETTLHILRTLASKSVTRIAFAVRKPGATTESLMRLAAFRVQADANAPAAFDAVTPPNWADFVAAWDDAASACSGGASADCTPKALTVAEGGTLSLRIDLRGEGVSARFERVGPEPTPAPAAAQPAMIEGIAAPTPAPEAEPPATSAAFTMRAESTTSEPSALSGVFVGVCGRRACPILVTGEANALTGRVLGALGAAFPDNTASPSVAFATSSAR